MSWLSIDSAPRDHSIIRGKDNEGNVFLCRWWTKGQIDKCEDDDPDEWGSAWLDLSDPDIEWEPIVLQPTSEEL